MAFDPTLPADGAEIIAVELRAQLTGLKALLDALDARVAALEAGPPDAPQNPSATLGGAGSGDVSLNWDPVTGALSYRVYNNGVLVGSFSAPPANLTLTSGDAFSLTVTAVSAGGESGPSSAVNDTAP